MFKKIVTELIYSPALSGTLGECIKRLRNEKSKRQIGLIFILLAVVVQLFATLFPPESANANNPEVFLDGGILSLEDYLGHYDQNTKNIRDLFTSLGISRSDIANSKPATLPVASGASLWTMGNTRQPASFAHYFQTATNESGIAYYQPLNSNDNTLAAFVGSSASLSGWFAILKDTGALVTEQPVSSNCSTLSTPDKPLLVDARRKDVICAEGLTLSLSARTISPSTNDLEKAHPSDRIVYTVSIANQGDMDISLVPTMGLEDILEYSRILDNGGGEYDFDTRAIAWPTTTLGAQKTLERNFIVQLLPVTPSTATGQHVTTSYDCVITASFGNNLSIPVDCPLVKQVERLTNSLPLLSAKINIIFAVVVLFAALYLYLRVTQLLTELYIIRHIHLGGV